MENTKKAYAAILKLMKKHKDICVFDIKDLEYIADKHLFGLKLKEEYGFDINPTRINSLDWNSLGEYISIGYWGEKYRRTISYPDNGEQPKDELLLRISFSTGPFIFGGDYPQEFFYKFFQELKTHNPKYIDSANKSLYFSMDNAGKMFNEFNSILRKYNELNKEDIKQRQILKMEAELNKLKNGK